MIQFEKPCEYGKNNIGEFWKFSNGLMIQKGVINKNINISIQTDGGYYDDDYIVNMPQSFIDLNFYCEASPEQNNKIFFIYSKRPAKNNLFYIDLFSIAPITADVDIEWFAIGRWK